MANDIVKALALLAGAYGGYRKGQAEQKEQKRKQKIEDDWLLLQAKNLQAETEKRQAEAGKIREERFQSWIPVTDEFFGGTGVEPSGYKNPIQFGVESPKKYSVPADLFKQLTATKNKLSPEQEAYQKGVGEAKARTEFPILNKAKESGTTRQPTEGEIERKWLGEAYSKTPKGIRVSLEKKGYRKKENADEWEVNPKVQEEDPLQQLINMKVEEIAKKMGINLNQPADTTGFDIYELPTRKQLQSK